MFNSPNYKKQRFLDNPYNSNDKFLLVANMLLELTFSQIKESLSIIFILSSTSILLVDSVYTTLGSVCSVGMQWWPKKKVLHAAVLLEGQMAGTEWILWMWEVTVAIAQVKWSDTVEETHLLQCGQGKFVWGVPFQPKGKSQENRS